MILAYIGPEMMMPLSSIFAAIIGMIALFWRSMLAFLGRGLSAALAAITVRSSVAAPMPKDAQLDGETSAKRSEEG